MTVACKTPAVLPTYVMLLAATKLLVHVAHCPSGIYLSCPSKQHHTTQKQFNGAMLPVLVAISYAYSITITSAHCVS